MSIKGYATNKNKNKHPIHGKKGVSEKEFSVTEKGMNDKIEVKIDPVKNESKKNNTKSNGFIFHYPIVFPNTDIMMHDMYNKLKDSKWETNRDERESFKEGFNRGVGIAQGITDEDLTKIKIGLDVENLDFGPDKYNLDFDKIENVEDAKEFLRHWAYDAEENDRQYSPFEFQSKELEERQYNEEGEQTSDAYDAFEDGVSEGINAYFERFFTSNLD